MHEHDENEPWLLNSANLWVTLIAVVAIVVGLGSAGWVHHLHQKDSQVVNQIGQWSTRNKELVAKQRATIYLPKPGNVNLTTGQVVGVKQLYELGNRMTTFEDQATYNKTYRWAKSIVSDKNLFDTFLTSPTTDGINNIEALNLRMKSERVLVEVLGPQDYRLWMTYVPYHNTSDLYQENKLVTKTTVLDVHGRKNHWDKMTINNDLGVDRVQTTVAQLR